MADRHKTIAAILIAVILVVIICLHFASSECFADKREKADAIFKWFSRHGGKSSYVKYRSAMGNASNIVEYNDVKKLFNERNLTVASVESVI